MVDIQDEQVRYQVGLSCTPNHLTRLGRTLIAGDPDATPKELMLQATAFEPDGPRRIWKGSSIMTAGASLLLLYLLGFAQWTFGFATLARHMNVGGIEPEGNAERSGARNADRGSAAANGTVDPSPQQREATLRAGDRR